MTMEDADLRKLLTGYTERILKLRLDFLALQQALIAKGIIAPIDLAEAVKQVHQESKKALSVIQDALAKPDKQN